MKNMLKIIKSGFFIFSLNICLCCNNSPNTSRNEVTSKKNDAGVGEDIHKVKNSVKSWFKKSERKNTKVNKNFRLHNRQIKIMADALIKINQDLNNLNKIVNTIQQKQNLNKNQIEILHNAIHHFQENQQNIRNARMQEAEEIEGEGEGDVTALI